MTGAPDRQVVERLLTKLLSTAWGAAGLPWAAAQDSMVVTVVDVMTPRWLADLLWAGRLYGAIGSMAVVWLYGMGSEYAEPLAQAWVGCSCLVALAHVAGPQGAPDGQ